jgi:hypothetical protein
MSSFNECGFSRGDKGITTNAGVKGGRKNLTIRVNRESSWRDLLDGLADLLGIVEIGPLHHARLDARIAPLNQTVLRHLPIALGFASVDTAPICRALNTLMPGLHWRQNSSYAGAEFLDGYAYCELLGPRGHRVSRELALGLLLLAPNVTYPEHVHPAAEIYAVIAGHAEWRQGNRAWSTRNPGELVRHASMEPHAMRTSAEPLLAAYLWHDHLHEGARLVDEWPITEE